jgi:hypothetical protein
MTLCRQIISLMVCSCLISVPRSVAGARNDDEEINGCVTSAASSGEMRNQVQPFKSTGYPLLDANLNNTIVLLRRYFEVSPAFFLRSPFARQQEAKKDPAIRIIEASFGDQLAHKTCVPDLSICRGLAVCKFTVGEMCQIDSKVKNLEVTWDCGQGTDKKARAAAKGTQIALECGD